GYYARVSRRTVYVESGAMLAFWIGVLTLVGPWSFIFIYVVPVLVSNAMVMSYIATNHFLNALTETNDPLANTLSVTAPSWLERMHLQFGYHVEHHLFPTVSGRHARAVRDVLRRLYGDRYLTMPHARALRLLYARPKIHDGHDVLIDPRTCERFAVLAPEDSSMAQLAGPTRGSRGAGRRGARESGVEPAAANGPAPLDRRSLSPPTSRRIKWSRGESNPRPLECDAVPRVPGAAGAPQDSTI